MTRRSQAGTRYSITFGAGAALYSILMLICVPVSQHVGTPWKFLLAVLPVLGMLLCIWAWWRFVRDIDEYQRAQQLKALAGSIAITLVACFAYGMCAHVGAPRIGLEIVPAVWAIAYAISSAWVYLGSR